MEKQKVITLIMVDKSTTFGSVIGVYGDEEAFNDLARTALEVYYLNNYSNPMEVDKFVEDKLKTLNEKHFAEDKFNTWVKQSTHSVEFINYEAKIIELMDEKKLGSMECPEGLYLPDLSGGAAIIHCASIMIVTDPDTKHQTIILDSEDDEDTKDCFWNFNSLSIEKQRQTYHKVKEILSK